MKRIAFAVGIAAVVAVAAGAIWWLQHGPTPPQGKSAVKPRHRLASGPIPHPQVLQAVYGNAGHEGRLVLPDSRVASVWAQQTFRIGEVERVAVLVAVETEDSECHACPAVLGATVYRKAGDGWVLESKANEIGKTGSFGSAGSPEGLEERPIGPDKAVLLVPDSHTSQGITKAGVHLLLYAPPRWLYAGTVDLSGDNSGQCSDDPKERQREQLDPCWKVTGKLTLVPGGNKEFYDIHVTRKGTSPEMSADAPGKADETLVFDGKKYREAP